jgi:hypothetical protein
MRRRVCGRVVPDVSECSIAYTFTTKRSANVESERFRNVGFRIIVLPSPSRLRDQQCGQYALSNVGNHLFIVTASFNVQCYWVVERFQLISKYIFRSVRVHKHLKQIV